jgi:rhomboid domain-containing protein 1
MLFTGLIQVPWTKEDACVSSNKVLQDGDWKRMLISAFEHGDDMHLYYNMISFLVKGVNLEPKLGSLYFGYLNLVFSVACSAIYIGLAQGMAKMFTPLYLDQCAIGFSGAFYVM